MNPTHDFEGQVALVTGASTGIGYGTAKAFAEAGASVAMADVNAVALGKASESLTAVGHRVLGITCDVSNETQAAAMVARTVEAFGRLDMAFNNAGVVGPSAGSIQWPALQQRRLPSVHVPSRKRSVSFLRARRDPAGCR